MKVAYIYFLLEGSSVGVLRKAEQQAKALVKLGEPKFDIIVFTTKPKKSAKHLFYIKIPSIKENPLYIFYYMFGKYYLIDKLVNLKNYDYLILRSPSPDFSILRFFKKYNVVSEFHSKVIDEVEMKLTDNVSCMRKYVRLIRLAFIKRYLFTSCKYAKGILANSSELASYFTENTNKKIPLKMVSNGVDVGTTCVTGFKEYDGTHLDLAILASRDDQWHGIDRLLTSAGHYLLNENNIVINIHLLGNMSKKNICYKNAKNLNIIFHGVRFGHELDEIMRDMNLSICPLKIYKKNLNEASTIKVAEYFARGMPFIIGYKDSGIRYLDFNEDNRCFLEFPNDNSIIDFDEIIDFATLVSRNREKVIKSMRCYAEKYLDWSLKLNEYIQFVKELEKE